MSFLNVNLRCRVHKSQCLNFKCSNCNEFICQQCRLLHKKHSIEDLAMISSNVLKNIRINMQSLQLKLNQLQNHNCRDQQKGLDIIENCRREISGFVEQYFEEIKLQFLMVEKNMREETIEKQINDLVQQHTKFSNWEQTIIENPSKAIQYQLQNDKEHRQGTLSQRENNNYRSGQRNNKDYLMLSQNYFQNKKQPRQLSAKNNQVPFINYNPIAFRNLSVELGKVFGFERTKGAKIQISKSNQENTLCKFIQDTPVLLQYYANKDRMSRIQFRQFTTPLQSQSIILNTHIFLIGGMRSHKKCRQIWVYQRQFHIMRVVGMMKQGRVGHCLSHGSIPSEAYIFGGKGTSLLQRIDEKMRSIQTISQYQQTLIGSSGIHYNNFLFYFGGIYQSGELNQNIIQYNIIDNSWHKLSIGNNLNYTASINPLLQCINSTQLLILGGYDVQTGHHNSWIQIYNLKYNYVSIKEGICLPWCLLTATNMSIYQNSTMTALCQLKRSNNMHGPNLPLLLKYEFKNNIIYIDTITYVGGKKQINQKLTNFSCK